MIDILSQIIETKEKEVAKLYKEESDLIESCMTKSALSFYDSIQNICDQKQKFFITEFKRKSPSAGIIENNIDPCSQAQRYASIGAHAISVLTDQTYFGGSYKDLKEISSYIVNNGKNVLVLQKDFIIDEIQIFKARACGANMILLIARILSAEKLKRLKAIAEGLNMGVLVEIHDKAEYEKIKHLKIEVLGINNRNLKTFKTRLNHFYKTLNEIDFSGHIIAESGVHNAIDIKMLGHKASGFLIGQSLMESKPNKALNDFFQTQNAHIFKACGLRTIKQIEACKSDLIGINFSPISKRRINKTIEFIAPPNAVAVFKNNTEEEIIHTIKKHNFKYVQLYEDDINPNLIANISCKIILAVSMDVPNALDRLIKYAADCDLFLIDAASPGSGKPVEYSIPQNFTFPFILAGGINISNLEKIKSHSYCIGLDMASGIEVNQEPSLQLIHQIKTKINAL